MVIQYRPTCMKAIRNASTCIGLLSCCSHDYIAYRKEGRKEGRREEKRGEEREKERKEGEIFINMGIVVRGLHVQDAASNIHAREKNTISFTP